MIQHIHIPKSPQLRQIVSFLYYSEFNEVNALSGVTAIFPNASTNLTLVLEEGVDLNQSSLDTSIYANCSSTAHLETRPGGQFMGIQLNSYGMYFLAGTPMHEVQDDLLPLDYFFSASTLDRIVSRVKASNSIEERFLEMEEILSEEIDFPEIDPRLPFGISMLMKNHNLSMDSLSDALCLSNRGMQKLFKKYVGMSPAYFKRIKRFNKVTEEMLKQTDASLTSIALQCGYYDQAHFIKDFKHFGDIIPSQFLKLSVKSSVFYNL